jgi:hypothetical protein
MFYEDSKSKNYQTSSFSYCRNRNRVDCTRARYILLGSIPLPRQKHARNWKCKTKDAYCIDIFSDGSRCARGCQECSRILPERIQD